MTLEEALIEQCAPTLAGLKAASLFRFYPGERRQFAAQYRALQGSLSLKGLALRILKFCRETSACLVYLYRPKALAQVFAQPGTKEFLTSLHYDVSLPLPGLLRQLSGRLCMERPFPHEIGVFLGYPLDDVKGFIQNGGRGYTCCGCWKCYGDPRAARRRFSSYQICTAAYKRHYARGTPITQLIVAA